MCGQNNRHATTNNTYTVQYILYTKNVRPFYIIIYYNSIIIIMMMGNVQNQELIVELLQIMASYWPARSLKALLFSARSSP